jgi:hypothetical protein
VIDQLMTDQIEPGVLLKFTTGFSFVVSAPRLSAREPQHGLMINCYVYNKSTSLIVSLAVGDVISSGDNL